MNITVISKSSQPCEGMSVPRGATHLETAVVKIDNNTAHYSKYSTEDQWYTDAYFVGGMPLFVHGEGSRCCIKRSATEDVAAALNEFAEA